MGTSINNPSSSNPIAIKSNDTLVAVNDSRAYVGGVYQTILDLATETTILGGWTSALTTNQYVTLKITIDGTLFTLSMRGPADDNLATIPPFYAKSSCKVEMTLGANGTARMGLWYK